MVVEQVRGEACGVAAVPSSEARNLDAGGLERFLHRGRNRGGAADQHHMADFMLGEVLSDARVERVGRGEQQGERPRSCQGPDRDGVSNALVAGDDHRAAEFSQLRYSSHPLGDREGSTRRICAVDALDVAGQHPQPIQHRRLMIRQHL